MQIMIFNSKDTLIIADYMPRAKELNFWARTCHAYVLGPCLNIYIITEANVLSDNSNI